MHTTCELGFDDVRCDRQLCVSLGMERISRYRRRRPLMTEAHFTGGVARTERACFDLSTESRVLRAADDPAAEWDPQ